MLNTPYYKLDLSKLEKNLLGLRNAFEVLWPNFKVGYSFKTNNLPWLVSWMTKQGVLAEVVSTPEYALAKYVGYTDDQIIINGPNKGNETILALLESNAIVNLDSFEEIKFIIENLDSFSHPVKIGLRINFDLEKFCPGETIPGDKPGRFGFNIENGDFLRALSILNSYEKIIVVGLHGHHSTRTKSLKIFQTITEQLCLCAEQIKKLEYIDIGGCLFGDKPGAPTFDEYAGTVVKQLQKYNISQSVTLIVEPGAALVASPFSYICKVIGTKDIKGNRLVYTDGSKKHIAPQMNSIQFAYNLDIDSRTKIAQQTITGYTCIEMDRFLELKNEYELQIGDTIELFNCGAYTLSLAPLFIEYFPAVVVQYDNKSEVVREPWTTNEFVQKNKILS